MKIKYSIIIALYTFFSFINCIELEEVKEKDTKKHGCNKLLSEVADGNSKFTYCLIMNAVPINVCDNCLEQFNYLEKKYNETYKNETCRAKYFNKDRLNIIENTYLNSKAIWDKAFCKECSLNETQKTKDAIDQIEKCIQKYNTTGIIKQTCEQCRSLYEAANTAFKELSKKINGKICYDIQDGINRTRVQWSNELKCNERTANLDAFIAASSTLSILPILFYCGIIIYLKRRRNNIEALNTDFETENNRPTTSNRLNIQSESQPQPSQLPLPSQSELDDGIEENKQTNTKNQKKYNNQKDNDDVDDSDNDDDDDILD